MIQYHMSMAKFDKFANMNGGVHCGSLCSAFQAVNPKMNLSDEEVLNNVDITTYPVYIYAVEFSDTDLVECDDMFDPNGWEGLEDVDGVYEYTNVFELSYGKSYFTAHPERFKIISVATITYTEYTKLQPYNHEFMDMDNTTPQMENDWESIVFNYIKDKWENIDAKITSNAI